MLSMCKKMLKTKGKGILKYHKIVLPLNREYY